MTELAHGWSGNFGSWTTTSTSWGDITSAISIDSADLQGSKEYLLLFGMLVNGNDATNNENQYRIETNGSEISGGGASDGLSYHRMEPRRTGSAFGTQYFYMDRHTTPATPLDINPQFKNGGTTTTQAREGWSLALKIGNESDALNENLDFFWDEDTNDYTSLSNSAWQSGPSVTVGNSNDDYLFICHLKVIVNSASDAIRFRLDGAGFSSTDYFESEGENTEEEWSIGFAFVGSAIASQAVTLQFQTNNSVAGGMDVVNSRIAAIRLNRFENHNAEYDDTATQFAVEDTWYALHANLGFTTPASTRNLIGIGCLNYEAGDNNKTIQTRMVDDGSVGAIGGFSDYGNVIQNGTNDRVPVLWCGEEALTASYSVSVDMDGRDTQSDVTPPAERVWSTMALFTTELNAPLDVCDQDIVPTAIEASTYLAGSITDIDEGVDTPDANWLTLDAP